jgi:hypothetical protein
MNTEIKYGIYFLILGSLVLLWLIKGNPTHPLKNYFLESYIMGVFCIILGFYMIIKALINNSFITSFRRFPIAIGRGEIR